MINHSVDNSRPDLTVVEVVGSLVQGPDIDSFTGAILESCDDGCHSMILDMCGVDGIDSMGLGLLILLSSKLSSLNRGLVLARVSEMIALVLETTMINQLIPISPSIEDAEKILRQANGGATGARAAVA